MDTQDTRPFGFWTATALVVGGMIGTGIFLIPASLAPLGWTSVVGWGISLVGALSVAFVLSRLQQVLPDAGGAIDVTSAIVGPLPGVMIGWSYWVSCWAAVSAIAIGAVSFLSVVFPAINATPLTGNLCACGLIALLTLLNMGGAKRVGEFQVVTTILKLVPLIAVAVIALWLGGRGEARLAPVPPVGPLFAGLGAAVALTLFPFVGFEAAGIAAERVRDPARNIMQATMWGVAIVGLFYILVCSAIVLMLPQATVIASPAPFQLFIETYWSRGPGLIVALFAAISAIGALNCWVLIQGETLLVMGRAGLLPRWFARVSSRDVPVGVLLLSSGFACLLVLCTTSKTLAGVFEFAALLTTCASLWLYLAICVAALMRRVAVVAAIVGVPFCLFAFWGAGYAASGLSLVLMLTAVPLYYLRPRPEGAGLAAA